MALALAIIVSTLIAVWPSESGWPAGAGALLLALAILAVDGWISQQHGESAVPSPTAIWTASAFLVACGIVAVVDPRMVAGLIPILGGGLATTILFRFKGPDRECGRLGKFLR